WMLVVLRILLSNWEKKKTIFSFFLLVNRTAKPYYPAIYLKNWLTKRTSMQGRWSKNLENISRVGGEVSHFLLRQEVKIQPVSMKPCKMPVLILNNNQSGHHKSHK